MALTNKTIVTGRMQEQRAQFALLLFSIWIRGETGWANLLGRYADAAETAGQSETLWNYFWLDVQNTDLLLGAWSPGSPVRWATSDRRVRTGIASNQLLIEGS
jgi:hypothetical protein